MGVIWHKIWYDFWRNKSRTLQVVAIVAVGAFAIGMIINTRYSVIGGMEDLWQRSSPMTIGLAVDPAGGRRPDPGAETDQGCRGRRGQDAGHRRMAGGPGPAMADRHPQCTCRLPRQVYGTLDLTAGSWPGGKTAAICQGVDRPTASTSATTSSFASTIASIVLQITGTVYDNYVQPPSFGGSVQFYVDRDEYDYITGEYDFNLIMAGAARLRRGPGTRIGQRNATAAGSGRRQRGGRDAARRQPVRRPAQALLPGLHGRHLPGDGHHGRPGAHSGPVPGLQHDQRHRLAAGQPDRHHEGHRRAHAGHRLSST